MADDQRASNQAQTAPDRQTAGYDIVVVGAGTAGLTAAIYGARAGRSVLVFEGKAAGGQIVNTPDIENFTAIKHISGYDFAQTLSEQAAELGAELAYEQVTGVTPVSGGFEVATTGHPVRAGAVILATGAKNRTLGIAREQDFVGRGVSYCATCDGMFFRNRDVVVNGGGNTAVEDAAFLANICRKVYVVHRRDRFRADERDVERLRAHDNVEFLLDSTVTGIEGEDVLTGVEVTDRVSGSKRLVPASGLFVAIGQVPDNGAFANLVDLDPKGYIVAGEDCTTRTQGVFAAGDCRTKSVRQLVTAAADGAVAATGAAAFVG